jgi:hypothetical protein
MCRATSQPAATTERGCCTFRGLPAEITAARPTMGLHPPHQHGAHTRSNSRTARTYPPPVQYNERYSTHGCQWTVYLCLQSSWKIIQPAPTSADTTYLYIHPPENSQLHGNQLLAQFVACCPKAPSQPWMGASPNYPSNIIAFNLTACSSPLSVSPPSVRSVSPPSVHDLG